MYCQSIVLLCFLDFLVFFLMLRRPPRSTRTDTLFPYTTLFRSATDTPAIISISNFKGGVAKTTLALHAAQHFAIRGYRVLLVDCDSQASTTMMFGYRPDVDLGEDDTLYGHFHNPELLGVQIGRAHV